MAESESEEILKDEAAEAEADKSTEQKTEYEPRGEAEKVPWSKSRQKRDQTQANILKVVEALRDEVKELKTRRPGPQRTLADVLDELGELVSDPPDPEFAEDPDKARYKKQVATLRAEVAKLRSAKPEEPEKAPEKKAEPEKKVEEKPTGASQDDFYALLDAADKEYGGKHRREAVKLIRETFEKRGFTGGKIPTKDAVEDVVMRVYADLARKAPKAEPKQDKAAKAKSEKKSDTPITQLGAQMPQKVDGKVVRPPSLKELKARALAQK